MPLSADPDQIVEVQLESDAGVAPQHRATFLYRHMTCLQFRRRAEMLKAAIDENDDAKCVALLNAVLAFRLAGWRNVRDPDGNEVPSDPLDPAALDAALTPREKWALAHEAAQVVRLAVPQKKVSGSPASSGPGNSATAAGPPGSA